MKKFELTEETITHDGVKLFRIKALKNFGTIKKDTLGGWVEKEENLSQDGNAWIYKSTFVHLNDSVYDNDYNFRDARVYGNARVYEDAEVSDNACVCGRSRVFGRSWASGDVSVHDNAMVFEDAWVNKSFVSSDYLVFGDIKSKNDLLRICCKFYKFTGEVIENEQD